MNERHESFSSELKLQIDQICDQAEEKLNASEWPGLSHYLKIVPRKGWSYFLGELIRTMLRLRPGISQADVRKWLATDHDEANKCAEQILWELQSENSDLGQASGPTAVEADQVVEDEEPPSQIDNYHLIRELGAGGFGRVFLARDAFLKREVVLKLPRQGKFKDQQSLLSFLDEAQKVATLDHPGIVTVHHVGIFRDRPYIVQQYVTGGDLASALRTRSFSFVETARLIASVSESVSHAHQKKIVHRDLKPANILLDAEGRPRVADFGLALHESQQELAIGEIAGTFKYMSPEQIRGEAHRMDGRSDIWALGILLYRMLVGETPFRGGTLEAIREQITHGNPRPLRQLNPAIPVELERICLKCLEKKMNDRYSTASDLASDLRLWLRDSSAAIHSPSTSEIHHETTDVSSSPRNEWSSGTAKVDSDPIVPKGLVAFDARDHRFFLRLLPGPRNRDGLPEQIRFWKEKLESTDPDEAFLVGLIFGPSGCGKSSLVRAGILPLLPQHVRVVYVEATQADTEVRLLIGLRKHFPEIPRNLALPQILALLRRGKWLAPGEKVVLVLDQFEQWLNTNDINATNQLVEGLRQCDGRTVQALVLARDDFWMAISRFFQELELPLAEHKNFSAIDLFDKEHARKVLTMFGQAYGRLPADGKLAQDQSKFLDEAIRQLTEQDKIICVRLVLFAETVKSKPWTIEILNQLGNVQQIGTLFLEQTFDAKSINPALRVHVPKLKLILEKLLPESGSEIKGHFRSLKELATNTALLEESPEFAKLLDILDRQLKLITPTEPDSGIASDSGKRTSYYQLSHDFLVPSIRNWLNQNLRESPAGRALLRFRAQSSEWAKSQDDRNLPTFLEFIQFQRHIRWTELSNTERSFFARSWKRQSVRGLLLLTLAAAIFSLFLAIQFDARKRLVTAGVQQLILVSPDGVPVTLASLEREKVLALKELHRQLNGNGLSPNQKLQSRISLAILSNDYQATLIPLLAEIEKIPTNQWNNLLAAAKKYENEVKPELAARFEQSKDPTLRSRLAILLFHLGHAKEFETCFALDAGLAQRTALELAIWECNCPVADYVAYLEGHQTNQAFHDELALILNGVSQFDIDRFSASDRQRLTSVAQAYFETSASAAMHSSCEYLLSNKLGLEFSNPKNAPPNARWQPLSCGDGEIDLVMIRPEAFPSLPISTFGGETLPPSEIEVASTHFWASKTEITNRMFTAFAGAPENARHFLKPWVPQGDENLPATGMTMIQAIAFCNWLSQQNNLTPCYEESLGEKYEIKSKYLQDMLEKVPEIKNYFQLINVWKFNPEANGFRLPRNIELRACRFGTGTVSFPLEVAGSADLINRHEWYAESNWNNLTSPYPVARKMPNYFGLFDANGNVDEMLQSTAEGLIGFDHQRVVANFGSDESNIVYTFEMPISIWEDDAAIGFRVVRLAK